MSDLRSAVEVFDNWAKIGKDEGMEKGHSPAVGEMLEYIFEKMGDRKDKFSAIDIGCGNGWVVRLLQKNSSCRFAVGIDGSKSMIEKAKNIDPGGDYRIALLPEYTPESKFDVVHSMEFIYYLKEPEKLIKNIYDNWLNIDGWLIMGVDHYLENEESLSWPEKVGVYMNTKSEKEWIDVWESCGYNSVISWKANVGPNSNGTLVIAGKKN